MKSATVYLLFVLSLVLALVCQLGEAHSPKTSGLERAHLRATPHSHHAKALNNTVSDTLEMDTDQGNDSSSVFDSLLPSMAGIEGMASSLVSIISYIIYTVAYVASYIPSTIHWILAPLNVIDPILQGGVSLCGAPLLALLVPFATRALLLLSVASLFVPPTTIWSHTTYVTYAAYDWTRPALVRYIPHYTRVEAILIALYNTSGLLGSVAKSLVQFAFNRTAADWNVNFGIADKIGTSVKKLLNTTVATDVPIFFQEVVKEIIQPTQYTPAEIAASKNSLVREFGSRQGTMPFPPPKPLPSPPSSSPSATNAEESNVPPTSDSPAAKSMRKNLRSRNKKKTNDSQANDPVEPTYLDMTHIPKLN